MMDHKKYRPYKTIQLKDRTWPDNTITKAPIWCSVDLRDGNQSLPIPMSVNQKVEFFKLLVEIGYKEIEVGFPSASQTEYDFVRRLIDENLIPDDVTIQVLTQAREHLIRRSFEALKGVKRAVIHWYNSTSTKQREVVFGKSKEDIIKLGVDAGTLIKTLAANYPETDYHFEYSPESLHATETDYALEICNEVIDEMQPTADRKLIINLPTTVENCMPNVFADTVEWFSRNLHNRENIIISVHPHNDRASSVATAEMAVLAGADRVEGTLFGNGERTGNVDLIALGMNLYSQGVDPEIDFRDMNKLISKYQKLTALNVPERHPYAGELVYTAFSGSHQDAISKGLKAYDVQDDEIWEVPYLPIDPKDVGRDYEAIIRINSQSGKGGMAYVLEASYGYKLPKIMHPEFAKVVQLQSDKSGAELTPVEIKNLFDDHYLDLNGSYRLKSYSINSVGENDISLTADVVIAGKSYSIDAMGNGPISAFLHGINEALDKSYTVSEYAEHALTKSEDAEALAYIQIADGAKKCFGAGMDSNIDAASMKAILSSIKIQNS